MKKTFIKPKSNLIKNIPFYGLVLLFISIFFIGVKVAPLLSQSQQTFVIKAPNVITELGGFEIGSTIHKYSHMITGSRNQNNAYLYENITVSVDANNIITHVVESKEENTLDQERIELLFTRLKRETLKQLKQTKIKPENWGVNGKAILVNGNIDLEVGYTKHKGVNSDKTTLYVIVKNNGNRAHLAP